MKKKLLLLVLLASLFAPRALHAQQYVFDKKIPVPGDGGYDYLAIDEVNRHLFVSHGTSFNVVDLATETPIAVIDGMQGVHGIAIVNEVNKGFISDGKGKAVHVVDLTTFKILKTIQVPAEDDTTLIQKMYLSSTGTARAPARSIFIRWRLQRPSTSAEAPSLPCRMGKG
jgi:hypothetical protein